MGINKELSYREFLQRENNMIHSPYEKEMEFYSSVRAGDSESVRKLYTPLCSEGFGTLSKNTIRNLRYHLIITIAMVTRFCIEGGMESETAYTISDIYINKVDECESIDELTTLHKEVLFEFTDRMKAVSTEKIYSKPVLMSLDYIYDHLHEKIKLSDVSEHLSLSPQYLSKLFHKEVGVTVSQYITAKRIEVAKNMLRFSDYSPLDIGNYLHFSSHSHFIGTFKKYTGLTPKEYQEKYFRINWNNKRK